MKVIGLLGFFLVKRFKGFDTDLLRLFMIFYDF